MLVGARTHSRRITFVPAQRQDAHNVSAKDLATLIPLNNPVEVRELRMRGPGGALWGPWASQQAVHCSPHTYRSDGDQRPPSPLTKCRPAVVQAPSGEEGNAMTRSGGKAGSRQGQAQRRELFSAEDLSLQWREVRKAVSGSGAGRGGVGDRLPAAGQMLCPLQAFVGTQQWRRTDSRPA